MELLKVLVCQIGARRHYAVARGLEQAGVLEGILTDGCAEMFPWSFLRQVLPKGLQRGFLRSLLGRRVEGVEACKIQGNVPLLLWNGWKGRRCAGESRVSFWVEQNRRFGEWVASSSWGEADMVYAYNGAALEIFQEAKKRGVKCVLDQTAAPWRYNTKLLEEEMVRWPGWEESPIDVDTNGEMIAREEAEWELADRIICGSDFVVDSMKQTGGPWEKCRVVQYPTPKVPEQLGVERRGAGKKLRVLFVGTLQLRKGIQYFYEAAKELPKEEFSFRAVGPSNLTPQAEEKVKSVIDWRGRVLRSEVWEHYKWADVFVFPTLSEGSANVCWEALIANLFVVTTSASGVMEQSGVIHTRPKELVSSLRGLVENKSRMAFSKQSEVSVADYGEGIKRVI